MTRVVPTEDMTWIDRAQDEGRTGLALSRYFYEGVAASTTPVVLSMPWAGIDPGVTARYLWAVAAGTENEGISPGVIYKVQIGPKTVRWSNTEENPPYLLGLVAKRGEDVTVTVDVVSGGFKGLGISLWGLDLREDL